MQGRAVNLERGDDRNFLLRERQGEGVLFEDGVVGPTLRTVELRDERRAVFHSHLINAVLVAIEGEQTSVAKTPKLFHGGNDRVGEQRGERVLGRIGALGEIGVHAPIVPKGEGACEGASSGPYIESDDACDARQTEENAPS